jgi:hypothetical protein
MSMRMIQKVFGVFGAKGGKGAHAEARRRGEERGMDFHHQTIQLSNHQTELSHTEARRHGEEREMNFQHQTTQRSNHHTSTYGRMPMDAAHDPTIQRSNGHTGLRGRRFAAPWARAAAAAVACVAGAGNSAWGTRAA